MKDRALIYGTIAIDTLLSPKGQAERVLGGSACYAALAARLLTDKFDMLGVVGDDFPPEYVQTLEAAGISMRHVDRHPGRTFAWTGQYEEDMNHRKTLETIEGVQEDWQLKLKSELRERCAILVSCNVTPRLQFRLIEQCLAGLSAGEARPLIMVDFMKSWIERERGYVDKLLKLCDVALMNEEEACCYAGTHDVHAAGQALREAGPRYAIVKRGSYGSTLYFEADGLTPSMRCAPWPCKHAVDPTGAGDSFMGALAGYLITHAQEARQPSAEGLIYGMRYASVISSATCESFGTPALLDLQRGQLQERMKAYEAAERKRGCLALLLLLALLLAIGLLLAGFIYAVFA